MSFWKQLSLHNDEIAKITINDLFESKQRFYEHSVRLENLLYDYSKQKVNKKTLELLIGLAKEKKLQENIEKLFNGEIVNLSENRPALHTLLRSKNLQGELGDSVKTEKLKIKNFVENLHQGGIKNKKDEPITDVISIGIGGSDLGPVFVCDALQEYKKFNVHFISNVDSYALSALLNQLNLDTTICIVNSKTFTTIETISLAEEVKKHISEERFYAVTSNYEKALEFGISKDNVFQFWDWVGGRYSLWSTIGLTIAINLGYEKFEELLEGANIVDEHFYSIEFSKNIPVIMGLISVWNTNFLNFNTAAILPYSERLKLLPDYLQQLQMESNGKSVDKESKKVLSYSTSPILWGNVGCNCQHSFMQLLHQSEQKVPIDFIMHVKTGNPYDKLHDILLSSCLSQSKSLMEGKEDELHKSFSGDRPSSTILFDELSPKNIGMLIAMYEHKVFVESVIWEINPFDQWGVQLGKKVLPTIMNKINSKETLAELDSSTSGIINTIREFI